MKLSPSGTIRPLSIAIGAGLALAACVPGSYPANGGQSPANGGQSPAGPAPVDGANTAPQPDGSNNSRGPRGTPTCTSADLSLSMGRTTGAAGTTGSSLVFTNKAATSCVIAGFPGVSFVSAVNQGQQVGAGAERQGSAGSQVTLAPGQSAAAPVSWVDGGTLGDALCGQRVPVAGFRAYPPDETASMFVALNQSDFGPTACTNTTTLRVGAVVPGTDGSQK